VGGMAVVRNGAARTTMDVDVLIAKDRWLGISQNPPEFLDIHLDSAVDRINGVDIDIIHPGDERSMEIPLPLPEDIGERDMQLGGVFAALIPLLIIKCAVYRSKLREYGIEIAAKDLYDLTELLKIRGSELTDNDFKAMPDAIGDTLIDILSKVRPKNRSGKTGT